MKKVKIGPTLACADLMNVERDIKILDSIGVDTYHIDIMDGNYVPNYCLSWDFVKSLKEITSTYIDIHLMTENVDRDINTAISLGVWGIAFHYETGKVEERLHLIKRENIKAGLAVCPETDIALVFPYLDKLDYILIMGVKPGFSGQSFIPASYSRIKALSSIRKERGLDFEIYVDGGIDNENGPKCKEKGADILVAGKLCIFRDKGKLEKQTKEFISALS